MKTKKETKKETKKSKKKIKTYEAKVGCWNCDDVYVIPIKIGQITPQYINDSKIECKKCGCDTLKMYKEYQIEKRIMREIILHHRIEHMNDDEENKKPVHDAHFQ